MRDEEVVERRKHDQRDGGEVPVHTQQPRKRFTQAECNDKYEWRSEVRCVQSLDPRE